MAAEPIHNDSIIARIVLNDYRAAGVFRKFNINYCCAGNISLNEACQLAGHDPELIKKELSHALRVTEITNVIDFESWQTDFLIDYIVNIHHAYLLKTLPEIRSVLQKFVAGHRAKFPYLDDLQQTFERLCMEILPHLDHEEKVVFPYIRQLAHAYDDREPYAVLLVRTLRKSLEKTITHDQDDIAQYLAMFRTLTNDYTPSAGACLTHKVAMSMLKELDNNLTQHVYLENAILFPRALSIEQQLILNH